MFSRRKGCPSLFTIDGRSISLRYLSCMGILKVRILAGFFYGGVNDS
jgi:hypothetical protein